jgi:hypothetical protein
MQKLGSQNIEKNVNLIYEVVFDMRFGHELANREF